MKKKIIIIFFSFLITNPHFRNVKYLFSLFLQHFLNLCIFTAYKKARQKLNCEFNF